MAGRKAVISKVAFRQWLQSKEPGVSVGMPNNPHVCPLAMFLVRDLEDKDTYVCVHHSFFTIGDYRRSIGMISSSD